MKRNRVMMPLLLLTVGCSLSTVSAAQSAAQSAAPAASQDMVYVMATVTGAKKAPVTGLKAENFQLTEDGVPQKITGFSDLDGPWEIEVVVGHSQVMKASSDNDITRGLRSAVEAFRNAAHPKSRIHVEELKFGSDGLFAAIDRHLQELQKTNTPRRALVVITDGFDRQYHTGGGTVDDLTDHISTDAPNKLVEYSRKLNIPIYFLYCPINVANPEYSNTLGPPIPTATNLSNTELSDKDVLTTVAEQTGGAFVIGDPLHQVEAQLKVLAEELRAKYVLGYVSTNDKKDDKWRALKLKVTAPAGQKVDASVKKKYFVPKVAKK